MQCAPSNIWHGSCNLLPKLWQRLWKRWDEHLSLEFSDYLMYNWSVFQKLVPSFLTRSNGREWLSKEPTRVGAFPDPHHLRTEEGSSSKMLHFFCTLDDGESSKQVYVWMSNTIIKTSQNLTVCFMCTCNKHSCLANWTTHNWFLPNQPITGDNLCSLVPTATRKGGNASSCRIIKSFEFSSNWCRAIRKALLCKSYLWWCAHGNKTVMNFILWNCTKYILF